MAARKTRKHENLPTPKPLVALNQEKLKVVKAKHSLTVLQMELVDYILMTGDTPAQAAVFMKKHSPWAYDTLKKQHVQLYMIDAAKASMSMLGLRALGTAASLLQAKSDRIKADVAMDLMQRAGIGVAEQGVANPVAIQINLDTPTRGEGPQPKLVPGKDI